jgi:GMP synthase-like glutamine amidotransferase
MRGVVFQHLDGEVPGLFGDILHKHGIDLDCVHLHAGQIIPPLQNYDVMLVMGASQQVWQEDLYPWLAAEKAAIRHWVQDLHKPYFGVCFGHQLLAEALGGEVQPSAIDELGMLEVARHQEAGSDAIFSALAPAGRWLQWHTAEVVHAPASAFVAASSKACKIQAMRVGTHAISIQFHAETTIEHVDGWVSMRECVEDMTEMRGEGAHDRFLAAAHEHLPEANRNAERLFAHWLEVNSLVQRKKAHATSA